MIASYLVFLLLGILFSFAFLTLAVYRRWLVPGWTFHDQTENSEAWKTQCEEMTRLASLAATMAEQLSRASYHSPGANQHTP